MMNIEKKTPKNNCSTLKMYIVKQIYYSRFLITSGLCVNFTVFGKTCTAATY